MARNDTQDTRERQHFFDAIHTLEQELSAAPDNSPKILRLIQEAGLKLEEWEENVHQAIHPKSIPEKRQVEGEKPFDKSSDPTISALAKRFRDIQEEMPLPVGLMVSNELMAINADPLSTKREDKLRFLLDLPWGKRSQLKTDIPEAEKTLRESHFGMDEVKDTVIEHVSVGVRTGKPTGTIICLAGPPGVGKTSIMKSIAKATGRKFGKVALGGVRGDNSIRGHSFTFEGSQPGRILKMISAAGTMNPVIGLDEIDKVDGDAAANALLEVLDPEQNHVFEDHYVGCPFDLSHALFICTANDINAIPSALRSRMEIIDVEGYIRDEKLEIAKRYLVQKQFKEMELTRDDIEITEGALRAVISEYTREAGVRKLEKAIAKICRQTVWKKSAGQAGKHVVTEDNLQDYLGVRKIVAEQIPDENAVGQVNGLYYSDNGGGVLPVRSVITDRLSKHFELKATGQLGDVISESIEKAAAFVRSRAKQLGLKSKKLNKTEIHVDMEGDSPVDGPSAGAVMTASIISTLTNIPVRRDVAMTGTISLNGEIGPIGGLKQKLDGAVAAGVKTVLIPAGNEVDLANVPKSILDQLTVQIVRSMDDVLPHLLTEWPQKVKPEPASTPLP